MLPWGTAILLGIVEGLTEFVPVSSTGHLILTGELLGFTGRRAEAFEVFIQLGAILAVVWEYRLRLAGVARGVVAGHAPSRRLFVAMLIGFFPSALAGLALHELISEHLFSAARVAPALIGGGVLILVVESLHLRVRARNLDELTLGQALFVGIAQCLALWPGFSRSAATILGGLCAGLDRRTATEFSFFLAIPTMFAATSYSLLKNFQWLEPGDVGRLAAAFVVAFGVGWASVRWLLSYVSNHTFLVFAWYRIALGVLILLVLRFGGVAA